MLYLGIRTCKLILKKHVNTSEQKVADLQFVIERGLFRKKTCVHGISYLKHCKKPPFVQNDQVGTTHHHDLKLSSSALYRELPENSVQS